VSAGGPEKKSGEREERQQRESAFLASKKRAFIVILEQLPLVKTLTFSWFVTGSKKKTSLSCCLITQGLLNSCADTTREKKKQ
jgi:hypothetical protein